MVQKPFHKQEGHPGGNDDMGSAGSAEMDHGHHCGRTPLSENNEDIYRTKRCRVARFTLTLPFLSLHSGNAL